MEPDTRKQSWQLLTFIFALANFLEVAIMAHFVLFTPAFLQEIGFSQSEINTWTGPIASISFLVGIWLVPFWGVFADRYGRKPLILRSYYVELAAMLIAALSRNLWLYLLARGLTGLALGNTGLMYASMTETTPRNRVALSLSLVNGSAPLGSLVGSLVGGIVVSQFGVHVLFGLDAFVAAIIVFMLSTYYRDPFVPKPTPRVVVMLGDALRAVIHSPVAATLYAVSFVFYASSFFSFAYLPVRIGQLVGETAAPLAIGITQGFAGGTTLIGSAIWGGLADRAGHRRLLAFLMLAVTVLWVPMFFAGDLTTLSIAWAVLNSVSPAVSSVMFTIISLNVPTDKRGSVLSMIYLPMNLAYVVAPVTASLVATNFAVRDVFLGSAALSLVALLIFVLTLGRTRSTEVSSVAR